MSRYCVFLYSFSTHKNILKASFDLESYLKQNTKKSIYIPKTYDELMHLARENKTNILIYPSPNYFPHECFAKSILKSSDYFPLLVENYDKYDKKFIKQDYSNIVYDNILDKKDDFDKYLKN